MLSYFKTLYNLQQATIKAPGWNRGFKVKRKINLLVSYHTLRRHATYSNANKAMRSRALKLTIKLAYLDIIIYYMLRKQSR